MEAVSVVMFIVGIIMAFALLVKALRDTTENLELLAEKHNQLCRLVQEMVETMDSIGLKVGTIKWNNNNAAQ